MNVLAIVVHHRKVDRCNYGLQLSASFIFLRCTILYLLGVLFLFYMSLENVLNPRKIFLFMTKNILNMREVYI